MGFRWKHNDMDELIHAVIETDYLLKKLIALLRIILQLMHRLNMEHLSARREYEEALHTLEQTLEQLQHTNNDLRSMAELYRQIEEADTELLLFADQPEAARDAEAGEDARDAAPEQTAGPETGAEAAAEEESRDAEAPSPDVRVLFDHSASAESAKDTAAFSIPGPSRRQSALYREKRNFRSTQEQMKACHPRMAADLPANRLPQTGAAAPVPAGPRPQTGTLAPAVPPMDRVHFSAVMPRTLMRGEYAVLNLFMYEKDFRQVVEELLRENPGLLKEDRHSVLQVQQGAAVRVELYSPDLELTDNILTQTWLGEYLRFDFSLSLPQDYPKRQVLFTARVYINDLIATRLTFLIDCATPHFQVVTPRRRDVLSAFMSYASEDRARAAAILLGMQKARPDLHVFFDVESLRSGENWQQTLPLEISRRDIFFLCWSHNARESLWVNREWNCALKVKGLACIEPIPLESPDLCPPPQELDGKQFNDRLLYIMNAERNRT